MAIIDSQGYEHVKIDAATLTSGDVEIGAVEIKNSTDDTRATVGANGLYADIRNIQAGVNSIGFATVQQANQPALVASSAYIGLVTANVGAIAAGANYIGLVSANIGGIAAGANYIGLASVNVGGTLPALTAGVAGIGFATVNVAAIAAGVNSIGYATVYNLDPLLISGEDQTNDVLKVEQQFTYATHVANSTAAVKASAGLLGSIIVGNISCPTITIWDNTLPSGTYIHRFLPNTPINTYIFNCKFPTGLTVDALAGVAPQLQISYR